MLWEGRRGLEVSALGLLQRAGDASVPGRFHILHSSKRPRFFFLPLNRRLFHLFGWAWTVEVDGWVMGAEEVMEVDVGKEHFSLGLFYLFICYRIKYPRY